jgi:hypothetical protein
MNLEIGIVMASRGTRYRTEALAALLGLWSRSFAYRADACSLIVRGGYVSSIPLLRVACDCIGAQRGLAIDHTEFTQWLETMGQSPEHGALDVGLGRYRAGSVLAGDDRLGALYRAATDLSMTHFGPTLLQVAPESDSRKLSIAFADSSFHLAWAQVLIGWLLVLIQAQLETALAAGNVFAAPPEAKDDLTDLALQIEEALAKTDRCRLEELADGRYLLRNFRRQPGEAPRRFLL